jgi:hypothetical protein
MTRWNLDGVRVAGEVLLLVALLALGVAVATTLVYGVIRHADRARAKRSYLQIVLEAFPFIAIIALVGALSGQVAGGSREGVVGQVLPALFAAFGGFTAYYVGIKRDRGGKVAVNSVAFLLGFFVMYNVSAVWRQDPEAWAFCRELYASSDFESPAERVDRNAVWSVYCGDVFKRWSKQIDQVAPTPPQ